jgi:translation initiation factor 4G
MTYDTFDTLTSRLLHVGIESPQVLQIIMNLIYDKAVSEQHFSTMYSQLCRKLSSECPSFDMKDDKKPMVRFILIYNNIIIIDFPPSTLE